MATVLSAQHTMLPVWAGGRPELSLGHFAWLTPSSLQVNASCGTAFTGGRPAPKGVLALAAEIEAPGRKNRNFWS